MDIAGSRRTMGRSTGQWAACVAISLETRVGIDFLWLWRGVLQFGIAGCEHGKQRLMLRVFRAMRIGLVLVLVLLTANAALAAELVLPESAQEVLVEYSAAFNRYDCEAMLALTSPVMLEQLDRTPDGRTEYCQQYVEIVRNNSFSESLGDLADFRSEGAYRLAVVRAARNPGSASSQFEAMEHAYFLHSSDAGETWKVLDLSCTDADWVRAIYPPFDGSSPIVIDGLLSIE